MFKIVESVVYGHNGVMKIVDIKTEEIADVSRTYYVLEEINTSFGSLTYVPVDNEKLTSLIRPLMEEADIKGLLCRISEIEPAPWIEDNRRRADNFKSILASCDIEKIISMLKAIYHTGKAREAAGKKNFLSDENIKHKAEELIHSEICAVLSVDKDEVPKIIREYAKGRE